MGVEEGMGERYRRYDVIFLFRTKAEVAVNNVT